MPSTFQPALFPQPDETIAGLWPQIRARQNACRDLLQICFDRIDEWELRVQAWVSVDRDGALRQARQLDDELAAGRWRGPLHGIPFGIKDIIDVAGTVTAAGFAPWRQNPPAAHDAPVVRRLRAAGAVILGKTVTTQFAAFDPPITRNPWNLDRTPGGSSSGSAAAVACGMCLAALGTQTGGSIMRPAAFCGVAGLKPSYGLLSLEGIVPLAASLDHVGPLSRSAADLSLVFDALRDGPASPADAEPHAPSLAPIRIGRVRGLFDDRATPEARAAVDTALARAASAGATIHDVELPAAFANVLARHRVIMAVEAAAFHVKRLRNHPHDYGPAIRALVEEGLRTPPDEYARCREFQRALTQQIAGCFEAADVLACPAATGPAPDRSTTGDPALNSPWSLTGLPTVCLPAALAADGMPLAVQFIGRAGGDDDLLRIAAWAERSLFCGVRGS